MSQKLHNNLTWMHTISSPQKNMLQHHLVQNKHVRPHHRPWPPESLPCIAKGSTMHVPTLYLVPGKDTLVHWLQLKLPIWANYIKANVKIWNPFDTFSLCSNTVCTLLVLLLVLVMIMLYKIELPACNHQPLGHSLVKPWWSVMTSFKPCTQDLPRYHWYISCREVSCSCQSHCSAHVTSVAPCFSVLGVDAQMPLRRKTSGIKESMKGFECCKLSQQESGRCWWLHSSMEKFSDHSLVAPLKTSMPPKKMLFYYVLMSIS